MSATYINPKLPSMIRELHKSDPSERSVRVALGLAADLIEELIDLKPRAEAAEATLERIREVVSGHPECDRYSDDDPITCGWKAAYASVVSALAPVTEEGDKDGRQDAAHQE